MRSTGLGGRRVGREGDGFITSSLGPRRPCRAGTTARSGRTGTWRKPPAATRVTGGDAAPSRRRGAPVASLVLPSRSCPRLTRPSSAVSEAATSRGGRAREDGGSHVRAGLAVFLRAGRAPRRRRLDPLAGLVARAASVASLDRLARWMARCYARLERRGWRRLRAMDPDGSSHARDRVLERVNLREAATDRRGGPSRRPRGLRRRTCRCARGEARRPRAGLRGASRAPRARRRRCGRRRPSSRRRAR